ncbi:hypothetical protein [Mesorhizobium sp. 131-2-1]|uniref:hypothetical protein n=1 Tax=Mesorhizobium sp. 131-2-1 TaxID=2744518 RepID=UPI0019267D72|nr:hypothetical protein [Mesorhizobium sp. 131-2-1]
MPQLRPTTVLMSAMLATATLPALAPHASAQVVIPTNRNVLVQQNELQQLQSRLQRQQFQQQQQLNRELDRQIVPQPRPQVPVVKPSCQVLGNAILTSCR